MLLRAAVERVEGGEFAVRLHLFDAGVWGRVSNFRCDALKSLRRLLGFDGSLVRLVANLNSISRCAWDGGGKLALPLD
jgi:hypothetical protein